VTACDPTVAWLTGAAETSPVSSRVVTVDGIPMSALLAEAPHPRAVIVALHGGAAKSSYFDCPNRPWLSLLRTGAALGFAVLALDRPGYGASAPHADTMSAPESRVELSFAAIDEHLGSRARGTGVFLMAHSLGCELGMRMAADKRGADLLGLEIAGSGRTHHPTALEILAARNLDATRPRKLTGLGRLLWQPPRLYPDDPEGRTLIGSPSPDYEAMAAYSLPTAYPELAPRVRIPVQYTLGDHERVWLSGPEGLADIAALFTASPRVLVNEQSDSGHNLSIGHSAMAYHLKVLSFVEECVLARENETESHGGIR
jgi:pimeloyl-ACP methyl ester carboxylesterase